MLETNNLFPQGVPNIVSIGTSCRPRFQIERHLQVVNPNISYPTFFWDWLYFEGSESIVWTLENDFQLRQSDFAPYVTPSGRFQIQHYLSGLVFFHEFGDHESEEDALNALKDRWDQVSEKFAFLAERTRSFISKNMEHIYVFQGRLELDHASRICELLRINANDNILVNVLQAGESSDLSRSDVITTRYVDDERSGKIPSDMWEGCNISWERLFGSLKIRPDFKDSIQEVKQHF